MSTELRPPTPSCDPAWDPLCEETQPVAVSGRGDGQLQSEVGAAVERGWVSSVLPGAWLCIWIDGESTGAAGPPQVTSAKTIK